MLTSGFRRGIGYSKHRNIEKSGAGGRRKRGTYPFAAGAVRASRQSNSWSSAAAYDAQLKIHALSISGPGQLFAGEPCYGVESLCEAADMDVENASERDIKARPVIQRVDRFDDSDPSEPDRRRRP